MRPRISRTSGFTLTELLVVIALIGLLATTMGVALTGSKGRSLTTAQREVMSALNVARISAIKGGGLYKGQDLSGTIPVAALVINVDRDSPGYLRQFGVVAGRCNSGYGSGSFRWKAVGQPMMLPEGIYFVTQESDNEVEARSNIETSGSAVLSLTYPYFQMATASGGANVGANIPSGDTADYYCVFFGGDGTLIPPGNNSPNSTYSQNLVMGAGQKTNIQTNGSFDIEFPAQGQVIGVRTVRYGNPIPINDPEDLLP